MAWTNLKSWMELNFLAVSVKRKQRSLYLVNLDFWTGSLVFLATCSRSSVKSLGVIFVGLSVWPIDTPSCQDKCLSVAPPAERKLWSAFITSSFDYCYSLYFSVDQFLLRQLQLVQNAAARLLTGKKATRSYHTPSGFPSLAFCQFQVPVKDFITCF